jgi:Na+/proline symporter
MTGEPSDCRATTSPQSKLALRQGRIKCRPSPSGPRSTSTGSLNSWASTIVNELYRPFTGRSNEHHLLRFSRLITVLWGGHRTAVAFGARRLEDNVVNNALAIVPFVSGILLGVVFLGVSTRRVRQPAALVGVLGGISSVTYAKFGTLLA